MIDTIKFFFEKQAFGVCAWWGKKLGIDSNRIRLYFIYASFLAMGSPLLIYLIMAFILDHKEWFKALRKPHSVWDI